MNTVKTYRKVNAANIGLSFGISRMQDIYTKRHGKTDVPHRHEYFTILIIRAANGLHKIDFNTYELSQNQIFFVAPGQVHQLFETEKSVGFVMTFSHKFLIESSIPISFIESLSLFNNYGYSPPLLPNREQFKSIEQFAEQIFSLFTGDAKMKNLSIGAFLKLMLIKCNNICAINPIQFEKRISKGNLIRDFKTEVDKHYNKEHSTSFYANRLNITSDHLNRVVKSTIGKTAKEYIQARITTEAKRLLYFTDISNKEIAYELGFDEPANFSAFFKNCTQVSPSKFREIEDLG